MKKALPVIGFCLKTAFAIFLIYALVFILLTYGLTTPPANTGEFTLLTGNYGKNPVWLPVAGYTLMNDLYGQLEGATAHEKMQIAVAMYREALKRIAMSEAYSYRCLGTITFDAAGLGGDVVNTQIKSIKRIGTPTLDPNHPSEFYYQNIVTAANINADGVIKGIMESAITKGLREYGDGYNISREMNSNEIFIDETGGGAKWGKTYTTKTIAEDTKGGRQYNDPAELREVSNLIINEASVLPETVKIERVGEVGDDGEEHSYYNISFSLNCENPTDSSSAVYYEAESIRKQVGESLLKRLAYTEAKLQFKIYDTGYLTEWSMADTWEATFKVLFDIEGSASMMQTQAISYMPSDCAIHNFTKAA